MIRMITLILIAVTAVGCNIDHIVETTPEVSPYMQGWTAGYEWYEEYGPGGGNALAAFLKCFDIKLNRTPQGWADTPILDTPYKRGAYDGFRFVVTYID